jgi:hypothetical protein
MTDQLTETQKSVQPTVFLLHHNYFITSKNGWCFSEKKGKREGKWTGGEKGGGPSETGYRQENP